MLWDGGSLSRLFKALEVSPAFAPNVFACWAILHILCIKTDNTLDSEDRDLQVSCQETIVDHITDWMAAFLCTRVSSVLPS